MVDPLFQFHRLNEDGIKKAEEIAATFNECPRVLKTWERTKWTDMLNHCEKCGRRYNDEHCSTLCPHSGIGYCAVCDCVVCVCEKEVCPDWDRSTKGRLKIG